MNGISKQCKVFEYHVRRWFVSSIRCLVVSELRRADNNIISALVVVMIDSHILPITLDVRSQWEKIG